MYKIKNVIGSVKSIMASKKEKIIVLDVEGYATVRPYNVGYIIADLHGNIYRRRSFAIMSCLIENIEAMNHIRQAETMTIKNTKEILEDFEKPKHKRKYQAVSIETFTKIFTDDIKSFKIKRLFAYNVTFDKGRIKDLIGEKTFATLNLQYCDIITGITQTKLKSKDYINFCIKNNYLTPKGYISTKAEIVIRYLKNDLTYEEEHTGLNDVLDEYFILMTAINTHKKIGDWQPIRAWKVLNDFSIEKGIIQKE